MKRHVVDFRKKVDARDITMTPEEAEALEADRARPRPPVPKRSETDPLARLLIEKNILTASEVDAVDTD